MTPRPFYRSLTFWSGLLVAVSLCWGWQDSRRYQTAFYAGPFFLVQTDSYLGLGRLSYPVDGGFERDKYTRNFAIAPAPFFLRGGKRTSRGDTTPEDVRSLLESGWAGHPGNWGAMLPHWLLLLGAVSAWAGALLWRAKRIQRAAAPVP